MRDKVTPPRKKPKSTKPRIPKPADKCTASPHTPVTTLRKVGIQLEIPEEEMTVEKLMAAPVEGKARWLSMINCLLPIYFGPMGACSPIYGETLLCKSFYVLIMDLMLMSEMVMCIRLHIGNIFCLYFMMCLYFWVIMSLHCPLPCSTLCFHG
jgi:hypothetical protein